MAYNKLEPIEGKRTKYMGLWYQREWHCFSSSVFNLAQLRRFKGNIRIKVVKNRYHKDGDSRPNYVFTIMDANGPHVIDLEVEDDPDVEADTGGERLYTYDEVQYAINRAVCDAGGDRCYGEYLVSDYL